MAFRAPWLLPLLAIAACSAAMPKPPAAGAPAAAAPKPRALDYPHARVADVVEHRFGVDVHDPYRWMEDGASPEVKAWTDAEDAMTRAYLDALPEHAALVERMRALYETETRGTPVVRGKRLFFTARSPHQEKEVLYWRDGDGADRALLDQNSWAKTENPTLQSWSVSPDGTKVAYAVALHNADEATLRVIDVASGVESSRDVIPDMDSPSVSWGADSKSFVYRYGPRTPAGVASSQRNGLVELRRHRLGDDPARDARLHEKTGDATLWLDGQATRDGHWLFATVSHGDDATEIQFRDVRRGDGDPRAWATLLRAEHVRGLVDEYRDRFYVATSDGAANWRVFVVEPLHPERAAWKEIVPERRDARLQELAIVGGRLLLKYYKDVATRLEVHRLDGSLEREISLPEIGTAELPSGEPDGAEAYFAFSSFTRAPEIHHLSLTTGATTIWHRTPIPADLSRFDVEQAFYPSTDGTRVPIFVVHAKGMVRDGRTPTILEGYGGFDITYGPEFTRWVVAWLERGGIFAWADVRGGGEYGEAWHRAGMLHAKQNVFDDFASGAEWLAREGFTSRDHLVAMGRSNGGLLMGAVMTQRPELFCAIVCGAPVLDMVRFALSGAGRGWIDEYGDPEKEDDFRALFAYSPVHHVRPGVRYPATLVVSPLDDDRVDPMHARKLAAALQAASSGGPVLFRVERESGHFGAGSQVALADRHADEVAFALAQVASAR